jgi:hypothetical protein
MMRHGRGPFRKTSAPCPADDVYLYYNDLGVICKGFPLETLLHSVRCDHAKYTPNPNLLHTTLRT